MSVRKTKSESNQARPKVVLMTLKIKPIQTDRPGSAAKENMWLSMCNSLDRGARTSDNYNKPNTNDWQRHFVQCFWNSQLVPEIVSDESDERD